MEIKRYLKVVASAGDEGDDYSMVEISNRRAIEATDRIEKLEAALRALIDANDNGWHPMKINGAEWFTARKALEDDQ